jgi:nitroreductase
MSVPTATFLFIGTAALARGILKRRDSNASNRTESNTNLHAALSLPSSADTLNLIEARRSIFTKQFTGRFVSREVIDDMLEAAKWAPNHHSTEPWRFYVYESKHGRESVGHLLHELYRSSCAPANDDGSSKKKPFSQAKYDKKLRGALQSSHIIAICVSTCTKNPFVEEVCSVAMAVQNMHLMATAHGVGAYWSSGGVYASCDSGLSHLGVLNPKELSAFLECKNEEIVCLGWLYVGDYYGTPEGRHKVWPSGKRADMRDKVVWR